MQCYRDVDFKDVRVRFFKFKNRSTWPIQKNMSKKRTGLFFC